MKRTLCIIGALLMLMLFCACSPSKLSEEEVREFYMEYVETAKEDRIKSLVYIHYEDEYWREADKESGSNLLYRTDILNMERLNDDLWLLQIYYESVAVPQGNTIYHFVGLVDGECKIMKNWEQVPASLAEGLNLEQYMPTGEIVYPDEIIIPEGAVDE